MVGVTDELYLATLDKVRAASDHRANHLCNAQAVDVVRRRGAEYLVVSLGCDTEVDDGVGSWDVSVPAFKEMGKRIAALGLRTLIVQEGTNRQTDT